MHSSPGAPLLPLPLPASSSVSAELARLEARVGQSADPWARGQLAELGDAEANRVLRKVAETGARVRNLSAFIKWLAKQEAMQRNAAGVPTAESAACSSGPFRASPQEDSISGPFYQDDIQMEIQSPDGGVAFCLSNQARIEPVSTVLPCRLQDLESPVRTSASILPDLVEMEVESSPGWNPPGVQIQSPFSAVASPVANPGGMGAGYLEYQMPDSPARGSTPSPVRDVTMRIRQMDGPSGRVGVVTPLSVAAWNALREAASPQMLALGELEFHRFFLIRVYLAETLIGTQTKQDHSQCLLLFTLQLRRRVRTRLQVLALHRVFLHSTRPTRPTPRSRTRGLLHRRRATPRGRGRRRSGGLARPTGTTTRRRGQGGLSRRHSHSHSQGGVHWSKVGALGPLGTAPRARYL